MATCFVKRRFLMRLAVPEPGTSVGTVTVRDPWEPEGSMTFNLCVRHQADLTASPATVTLRASAGSSAFILVRTKEPTDSLGVVLQDPHDLTLSVDRAGRRSGRLHRVRLTVGRVVPRGKIGEARLRITAPFSTTALVVPARLAADSADDKPKNLPAETALVPRAN